MKQLHSKLRATGKVSIFALKDGKVVRSVSFPNLVLANRTGSVSRGLSMIVDLLAGDGGSPEITKAQLGTGTNAVSEADTGLQTLVVDNILKATESKGTKTLTLQFFAADADVANGTYKEIAFVMTANHWARALIPSPFYVKGTGEDTLIEYVITFANI